MQFLLEGSVRRGGDRVRINVQLIDAESANHVWAERYDRKLEDIFAIQDEITETVASTVADQVQVIGTERAKRKSTDNLEAYDYLLKGMDLHKSGAMDPELIDQAVDMFDKAIELDDGFARAYAWRACSGSRVWGEDYTEENVRESMSLIQTALSLDGGESESHRIMGALNLFKRDFERAETHIQQSLALNPNDAHIAVKAGTYFSFSGQANAALASVDRAMRLNPHHPEWYWTELGLAHHTAGDYGAAITALLHNTSPSFLALAILSASYVETGRMAEARATAKTLAEVKPNATLTYFLKRMPYKRAKDLDRLVTALRQAGIPEN